MCCEGRSQLGVSRSAPWAGQNDDGGFIEEAQSLIESLLSRPFPEEEGWGSKFQASLGGLLFL